MTGQQFEWEHIVYRFRDRQGALLYVGLTNDIKKRCAQHAKAQRWWTQVVSCEVEFHPTRDAAADAEHEAIHSEFPLYNEREFRSPHPLPGPRSKPTVPVAAAEGTPRPIKRLTEARPACVYAPGRKVPLRQQVSAEEWDWIHHPGRYADIDITA